MSLQANQRNSRNVTHEPSIALQLKDCVAYGIRKIWEHATKKTTKLFVRMLETYPAHAGTHVDTYPTHVHNMFKSCLVHAKHKPKILLKHIQLMSDRCQNMTSTCRRNTLVTP